MANKVVIVQWDKLQPYQQDLVVAMLNNSGGLHKGFETVNENSLWIHAEVLHPSHGRTIEGGNPIEREACEELWDGSFVRNAAGKLEGIGNSGPSGQMPVNVIAFALDIKIELGVSVE